MHADVNDALHQMLTDFELAYFLFLKANGLTDSPIVKVGFYAAAEIMVDSDPLPQENLQERLLLALEEITDEAAGNYLELIEFVVKDASRPWSNRKTASVSD